MANKWLMRRVLSMYNKVGIMQLVLKGSELVQCVQNIVQCVQNIVQPVQIVQTVMPLHFSCNDIV
jgi:hypothetical protein